MNNTLLAASMALLVSTGSAELPQDYQPYKDSGDYFECRRGAELSAMVVSNDFGYIFSQAISARGEDPWETSGTLLVSFAHDPELRVFGLPVISSSVSWNEGMEVRSVRLDADVRAIQVAVRAGYPGIRFRQSGSDAFAQLGHSVSPANGTGNAEFRVETTVLERDGRREELVYLRCRVQMFVPEGAGFNRYL